MEKNSFGGLLKELRLKHEITLREAARRSEISAPHFSDMEHGRKAAPSRERLQRIIKALELTDKEAVELSEAAGRNQNTFAYDLPDYIMNRDYVAAALRTAKDLGAGKEQWEKFVEELYANAEKSKNS